jgi:hypothetical protein
MKEKDIALIIVIVFVSGLLSFFISNKFISPPKHDLKAAKVEAITSEFKEPDTKYFNDQSVNPTQLIKINNNSNDNPFNGQ